MHKNEHNLQIWSEKSLFHCGHGKPFPLYGREGVTPYIIPSIYCMEDQMWHTTYI